MPQTKDSGPRTIPNNVAEQQLNVLAFLDLPPRQITLRDEALAIIDAVRTGMCKREDAARAIVNVWAREREQILDAVRRAGGPALNRPDKSDAEAYADGAKEVL